LIDSSTFDVPIQAILYFLFAVATLMSSDAAAALDIAGAELETAAGAGAAQPASIIATRAKTVKNTMLFLMFIPHLLFIFSAFYCAKYYFGFEKRLEPYSII
jgi:hypothetical protein